MKKSIVLILAGYISLLQVEATPTIAEPPAIIVDFYKDDPPPCENKYSWLREKLEKEQKERTSSFNPDLFYPWERLIRNGFLWGDPFNIGALACALETLCHPPLDFSYDSEISENFVKTKSFLSTNIFVNIKKNLNDLLSRPPKIYNIENFFYTAPFPDWRKLDASLGKENYFLLPPDAYVDTTNPYEWTTVLDTLSGNSVNWGNLISPTPATYKHTYLESLRDQINDIVEHDYIRLSPADCSSFAIFDLLHESMLHNDGLFNRTPSLGLDIPWESKSINYTKLYVAALFASLHTKGLFWINNNVDYTINRKKEYVSYDVDKEKVVSAIQSHIKAMLDSDIPSEEWPSLTIKDAIIEKKTITNEVFTASKKKGFQLRIYQHGAANAITIRGGEYRLSPENWTHEEIMRHAVRHSSTELDYTHEDGYTTSVSGTLYKVVLNVNSVDIGDIVVDGKAGVTRENDILKSVSFNLPTEAKDKFFSPYIGSDSDFGPFLLTSREINSYSSFSDLNVTKLLRRSYVRDGDYNNTLSFLSEEIENIMSERKFGEPYTVDKDITVSFSGLSSYYAPTWGYYFVPDDVADLPFSGTWVDYHEYYEYIIKIDPTAYPVADGFIELTALWHNDINDIPYIQDDIKYNFLGYGEFNYMLPFFPH